MVPNQLLAVAGFGITAPGGAGGKLNTATVAFVSNPIGVDCDTTRCTQLLAGELQARLVLLVCHFAGNCKHGSKTDTTPLS